MAQYAASAAQQHATQHSASPLSPSASVSASVGTAPPLTPSGTAPPGANAAAGPAPAAATGQSGVGSASAPQPQAESQSQSHSGARAPSVSGGGASSTAGTQHKRVYQACIPCRRRKVRCDLGSVDNPSDPPCVRCRRESKECYFSATRRKRKVDDDMTDIFDDPDQDDYILRNGRKQLRSGESPVIAATLDRRLYSDVPLTPGGSRGRAQPLRRPGDGGPRSTAGSTGGARSTTGGEFGNGEANTPLENFEARTVMRREVYGPHDALDLLYKAATDKLVDTRDDRSQRLPYADVAPLRSPMHKPEGESAAVGGSSRTNFHAGRPGLDSRHSSHHTERPGLHSRHASRQEVPAEPIDPELTKRDISQEPGYNEALKAWARFRFVRAGWFTAQEAIDYIE